MILIYSLPYPNTTSNQMNWRSNLNVSKPHNDYYRYYGTGVSADYEGLCAASVT